MEKEILDIFELLYNCHNYVNCEKKCCDECMANLIYSQGYRKVEEGGAVLTKEQNEKWLDFIKLQRHEEAMKIIAFIEDKDKKAGKYSIYSKLLAELKEQYEIEKN